jgi:hypothetical protein
MSVTPFLDRVKAYGLAKLDQREGIPGKGFTGWCPHGDQVHVKGWSLRGTGKIALDVVGQRTLDI